MYHAHFGFREEPFSVTPDSRFFFSSTQHLEAVASLYYAVLQRRGFAMLVGASGLGKTNIVFTLIRMLGATAQVAYLANRYYDHATLLNAILAAFGFEPPESPIASQRLFGQYLQRTYKAGKICGSSSTRRRTWTAKPWKPSACSRTSKRRLETQSRSFS